MKHLKKNIHLNRVNTEANVTGWKRIRVWLEYVADSEGKEIGFLNYSLVNDEDLLKMNIEKLKHDYYTDILTFDLSEDDTTIEGDVYLSYDRIVDNAKKFHVKRMDEMRRVFLHGLLHLLGYNDKTKKEKVIMKEKEDYYLGKYYKLFQKKD